MNIAAFSSLALLISPAFGYTIPTGKDYSCYHKNAWLENTNKHYNSIFSSYTGVLKSEFFNSSLAEHRRLIAEGGIREDISTVVQSHFLRKHDEHFVAPPSTVPVKAPSTHGVHKLAPTQNPPPPPPGGQSPPPNGGGGQGPPPSGGGGGGQGGGGGGSVPSDATVTTGWNISFPGIPNYDHAFSASEISSLNSRPKASTDFTNGHTSATAGEKVVFGEDIGFSSSGCSSGYWPPGPVCPAAYDGSYTFSLHPAPETQPGGCYASARLGYFVSGVAVWGWTDANTYNNGGVWYNLAMEFELYDMDICIGHAANGLYHHHSYSPCLMKELNDTGAEHSPIHGFAYDGYPIFGPYQGADTLAVSCWQPRDYAASSPTGCSDGQRSCLLKDEYNITKGVMATSSAGPNVGTVVTSLSGNAIPAVSGVFYQDYFYNHTCGARGGAYLDDHNGHDHDNIGYHYHVTMNAAGKATFPYVFGPKYYGCTPNTACSTAISTPNSVQGSDTGHMSQCGLSSAVQQQQCLAQSFDSGLPTTTTTTTTSSSDSKSSALSIGAIVGIAVGGTAGLILIAALIYWLVFQKSAAAATKVAASV